MNIYIDFDGTLYKTNELYNRFIKLFNKYNFSETDIQKFMKQEPYKTHKSFDILANKIINDYNLNKEEIEQELNNIYTEDLVYPDVIPFLEKYSKKYNLILLTLGNIEHQKRKINSSKLSKYFKDIIITNKDKSLLNIDYSKSIFIDNNPKEIEKFHNVNAYSIIRIIRNNDNFYNNQKNIIDTKEYFNFQDIGNYIDKIGGNYNE